MRSVAAQISLNIGMPDDGMLKFWLIVAVVGFLFWLAELISLLKRQDLKDVDKIVWVIVLCVLNILGAVLYCFLAPVQKSVSVRSKIRSEKELKDHFNSYSRYTSPDE